MIWQTLGVVALISLLGNGWLVYINKQQESAILAMQKEADLQKLIIQLQDDEVVLLEKDRNAKEAARALSLEEAAKRQEIVEELYRQIKEVEETNAEVKSWGDVPIPSSYLWVLNEARNRVRYKDDNVVSGQSPINGNSNTPNTGK